MEIAAYGNEIHQNHRLLDSIIHNSYDGIYVSDGQGNGVLVNEAYTRITGWREKS
ncbi:PAS domain-containing protein [Thalassobacillus sp. C254]|uniref:PAS domain-containing protein n=1 Tax=Thalassobacillus sp. C254 TaxID=1225341 RepID=UPI0022B742EC|nr:PAS domain-containing protein [Thalassobacillus sp. C254]